MSLKLMGQMAKKIACESQVAGTNISTYVE